MTDTAVIPRRATRHPSHFQLHNGNWWVVFHENFLKPTHLGGLDALPAYAREAYLRLAPVVPPKKSPTRQTRKRKRQRALLRHTVLTETGGACVYCGKVYQHLTIEHLLPVSRGGKDSYANLVPTCAYCNQRRADKPNALRFTHAQWLHYVRWKLNGCQRHSYFVKGRCFKPFEKNVRMAQPVKSGA